MKRPPSFRRPTIVRVCGRILPLLSLVLLAAAFGQDSQPPKPKTSISAGDQYQFGAGIELVTAPVTVTGPDKRYVAGLEKDQFRVYDNDREQKIIGFDVSFLPISLVLCIETSGRIEGMMPQIKKTGILYTDLVLGERGEMAVITFDSKVNVVQEFTGDSARLIEVIKKIKPGSDATRTSDAVWEAIRMLRPRPDSHRKVIVVVSETRDNGSEVHLGETLRTAQLANIMIYGIRLSTTKGKLTQPAQAKRDPFPPGVSARPMPPGVVSTPNTQAQSRVEVVNALPYIIEAIRGVKNLIFNDPLQLLTEGSGGKQLSPLTEGGMQDSVIQIGEELRSQYLLSYRPNNLDKGGFHEIKVEVTVDGLKVRTRPGYWLGPVTKETGQN
ncbi:MAG: VWA domain-containing protein [Acidobacteria bacterium]|nr:VWA domain-containing protein [Acidobacteriota bacterium]